MGSLFRLSSLPGYNHLAIASWIAFLAPRRHESPPRAAVICKGVPVYTTFVGDDDYRNEAFSYS